jgi:hypothetical protein
MIVGSNSSFAAPICSRWIDPTVASSIVAGSPWRIVSESDASGESACGHDWVCSGDKWCGHMPSLQQSATLESTPDDPQCTPQAVLPSIAIVKDSVTNHRRMIEVYSHTENIQTLL